VALHIVDRGSGTPIVVIPGVQGRWEWMRPAIDALAGSCRVVTFSLADEPSSGATFDEGRGFWSYVDQVRDALDIAGLNRAAICGVSYGGLIAAAFAARYPDRTACLVLVSALPPSWKPDARVGFYVRSPRLLTPLFLVGSLRLYSEIAAASSGATASVGAALSHAWRALTHMFSPSRMARRVRLLESIDLNKELTQLAVRTLVVTGEPSLDRVVPVGATLEYARLWPHTVMATIAHTGHLGFITRPKDFARVLVSFVEDAAQLDMRRHVG
jgi:pimeloyl-ACP methyl ester carboxylesterase